MFQKMKEAQNAQKKELSPREQREAKAKSCKWSILFIATVSVVNLIFALMDADTMMLFAPAVPYYLVRVTQAFENDFVNGAWSNGPGSMAAFWVGMALTLPYFICGFLCKNRPGWTLTAAILMAVDTVGLVVMTLLFMNSFLSNTMDYIIHALMLFVLFSSWKEQKKLTANVAEDREDPAILRTTDPEIF